MSEINKHLPDFELEIILMVISWDPVPKTFLICCRMRQLALLAEETIADIRNAAARQDTEAIKALFDSFREKFDRITSAPPK